MYSNNMKADEQSLVCVKAATTVLGDKWTPQLLCIFAEEDTVRFCQLQEEVGGINPRTLSARLSSLEQHDIIQKLPSGSSSRCDYRLTQKGRDLLPILASMADWGTKYPLKISSDSSQQLALG